MTPSLVLLGGDVRTMDARGHRASALAVAGSEIVAVGDDAEIRALAGPTTEVVELDGRTVVPGINDSHAHVGWWASALAPGALDVRGERTIAAITERVRAAAARTPEGEWIVGYGWDQTRLDDRRAPTAADLDAVAPRHPVALTHFTGHAVSANGEALRRAGVNRETHVPAGSVVIRDETGDPTGVLVEPGATGLVARCLPERPLAELEAGLEHAIADLHRRGITSFTEPALSPGDPDPSFTGRYLDAYERLARAGRLRARVRVLEFFHTHGVTSADDVRSGLTSHRDLRDIDPAQLSIAGVKLFADGVFSGRTSWVREPYVGGGHGSLVVAGGNHQERVEELRECVRLAHAAGRQVQVHATGDAAVDATVDAMVQAIAEAPRADPRHVLIHGVLTPPQTLRRVAEHGIVLNAQPTIARLVGANLFALLGEDRARDQSPLRSALDLGIRVALSTDIPIAPSPDWRATVVDAVRRTTVGGPVIERQRITLDEALRGVTTAGAWQDHAESWKGTVSPGKVADLCVLDGCLDDGDLEALRELDVAATLLGGAFVHRSGV